MILFWSYERLTTSVHNVVCLPACMHTVSRLVHLSMVASIVIGCRLPDVNKSLLQLINRIKLIPIHSKGEIAR